MPYEPTVRDMDSFVDRLYENQSLAGAKMLIDRHGNLTGQNLTGHFRQCFFAVRNFLADYPTLRKNLGAELSCLGSDGIYEPSTEVVTTWCNYLDANEGRVGSEYNYEILANILPSALGGHLEGGGGASSTLKRMLPLVAEYMSRNRRYGTR